MPRHWLATKGAEGRDSRGEPSSGFDPRVPEWGNPARYVASPDGGTHAPPERTPGTETSKYREEKKENRFRQ